jgi:hypothetical protein
MRGFIINPPVQARLRRTLWQGLGIALLAATGAHLLLLLLFKPLPKVVKGEASQGRFTVMLDSSRLPSDDAWGLKDTLKYGDPTLFAKPDVRLGFSSYRGVMEADSKFPGEPPGEANFKFAGLRQGAIEMDIKPWKLDAAQPSGWLHYSVRDYASALPVATPPPQAPLWLDASYRPLGKVADPHGEIAKALATAGSAQLNDTVVMLRDAGEELPPEMHVYKSCGVPALDSAALRSLSFTLASMPEALPKRGGGSVLFLKWTANSQVPFSDAGAGR